LVTLLATDSKVVVKIELLIGGCQNLGFGKFAQEVELWVEVKA
jgi:hypothetical protein